MERKQKKQILKFTKDGRGDVVRCNYCESDMLLPLGEDICPVCHKKGCLTRMCDVSDDIIEESVENISDYKDIFDIIDMAS